MPTKTRRRRTATPMVWPAGSDRAVEIVRSFIRGEQRRREQGEAWRKVLKARERSTRRTFV